MNKLLRTSSILLFLVVSASAFARNTETQKLQNAAYADSVKKDSVYKARFYKRAKGLYAEALGPGGLYSVNYDMRFSSRQNGLGARIGFSYLTTTGENAVTFPVVLNYLIGKRGRYLELGAGATYYRYHADHFGTFFRERKEMYYDQPYPNDPVLSDPDGPVNENDVIFSATIGYRYQALKENGLIFRIGVSPLFNSYRVILPWPYASIGFKLDGKTKKTNKLK